MIDIILGVLVILAVMVAVILVLGRMRKRKRTPASQVPFPGTYRELLLEHVPFYMTLSAEEKERFERSIQNFLAQVRITGVNTKVTTLDTVFIAASAVIPIFGFPDWEYTNLNEVLLYPETFSEEFSQTGAGRTILGMVGPGAMQNVMILSQHELRQGFLNKTGKTNTAIHEFVHLVDQTDGATDGIPENLMGRQYVLPWLQLMRKKIAEIMKGRSDINPYGATNEAEFFAVASEYFFERPDLLQQKHPELYSLLEQIFRPQKEMK